MCSRVLKTCALKTYINVVLFAVTSSVNEKYEFIISSIWLKIANMSERDNSFVRFIDDDLRRALSTAIDSSKQCAFISHVLLVNVSTANIATKVEFNLCMEKVHGVTNI